MSFAQPLWFLGLLLIPLLIVWQAVRDQRRGKLLTKFVAPRLASQLADSASSGRRWFKLVLVCTALAFLFGTLAQPRWGETEIVQRTRGRDILLVIDTSRSMLANDLSPSRLARVKLAAADLIGMLKGDRVGLIAFAGSAFLQAPLTGDSQAVLDSLRELDTDIIPLGGTNIAEALQAADDAFGKSEGDDRAVVLFTDGEELDQQGVEAAKELKTKMRIFTVGAGSPEGTVIAVPGPRGQMEYVKDPDGQIVKSRLDEKTLQAVAEAGGGFYIRLQSGPAEMQQVVRDGIMKLSAHSSDTLVTKRPIERFEWPLSAALLLLSLCPLIGERKAPRAAMAAFLLAIFAYPAGAQASNRGIDLYHANDFSASADHFEQELQKRPEKPEVQYDLGTAAYKAGQLERALTAFSQAIRADNLWLRQKAEYNLGNTLFQRGALQEERPAKVQDWKNALQHYEEALRVDPKDANATYNRDVVKKLLEEQQKEQKKEEEKKEQEQKQDQKDQQKKDDEKKDQQKGGGQGQDKQEQQKDGQGGEGDKQQGGKDQQKPGDKNGKGEQQPGKNGDQKNGQKSPQNGKGEQRDGQQQQPQDSSEQGKDGTPPKPKDGDIRSTTQGDREQRERDAEQAKEAAEEEAAAAAGKMTPSQARALLDSLRNEDVRVRLLNPTNKRPDGPRTFRDW